jgi:hypothetical protein
MVAEILMSAFNIYGISEWMVGYPEVIPIPRCTDRSPEVGIALGFPGWTDTAGWTVQLAFPGIHTTACP